MAARDACNTRVAVHSNTTQETMEHLSGFDFQSFHSEKKVMTCAGQLSMVQRCVRISSYSSCTLRLSLSRGCPDEARDSFTALQHPR